MTEVWLMLVLTCTGHVNAQCIPHIVEYPSKQACEDARLIAAAPTMLAALEDAEKEMRGWSWTGSAAGKAPHDERLARIRAAIARAKGENE